MGARFWLFFCTIVIAASAIASDVSDAIAPIHQFADGMNKGDTKLALGAFADETSIIDDLAPNFWHGKGATEQWVAVIDAATQAGGVTDGAFVLKKPSVAKISGANAYVVVPYAYTYRIKGKKADAPGTLTAVLRKGTDGWRIAAITFTVR